MGDQAFPVGQTAFKVAGDVVPIQGTDLQTRSNFDINRAIGGMVDRSKPSDALDPSKLIKFPSRPN